jgi:hypothetical protein
MRGVYLTGIACAALVFFFLYPPSASMGADLTFAPQLTASEGNLELSMTSQKNEYTVGDKKTSTTGTFMTEKLNLAAAGYVYHPRFLVFMTSLSEGLSEEGNHFGSAANATNYELRMIFLPEHPYNLELFTLHQKASAPGTFFQGQTGTVDERGAILSYKRSPYFMNTSYVESEVDSSTNRTSSRAYKANGAYVLPVMSNSAAYSHNESSSALAVNTSRDESAFGNTIRLADAVLASNINSSLQDQKKPLNPNFQTRSLNWTEQFSAPLPLNFTTSASYGNLKEIYRTGDDPYTGAPAKEEFNRSTNTSFNLSHRLYQSLVTNYAYNTFSIASTTGEITARSNSLGATYLKAIPSGRFTAGIQYGNMESERLGKLAILNESHSAALLGTFSLTLQRVIESTIEVQVKDPGTGSLITLPPGNYLISPLGANLQITILSVSPVPFQPDPAYLYEFHVSYSLSDQSKLDMTTKGYSVKMDLLDNLVSPYYNYSTTDQKLVSGSIAGGPDRTTSETTGLTCQAGDYSGLIEHQSFRSRLNPYSSWKTTADYRTPLSEDTKIMVRISYGKTDYFATPSVVGSTEVREKKLGTDLRMDMRFPRNNTNLFVAGSYYRTESVIDADVFSLNSYVTWHVGLLSVNGGTQLSRSESRFPTGNVTLFTQYYYVTVTRKLF